MQGQFRPGAGEPFDYDALRAAIHPDDRDRQAAAGGQALEAKAELEVEYRIFTPAGELRWIDVRGRLEESEPGSPRLAGVTLNVTERRQNEQLLIE